MRTSFSALIALSLLSHSWAATTINATNKFSYGANFGWMDWRGDTNNGAVIGEFVCSGFIHAANVGWINLGGGAPTNGVQYQNLAASDYGVNHDGLGNLRGFAYGANIGWINFETNGAPKVNLANGRLSGHVYSANCGWISLSNAFALVKTDTIAPGADSDGDGLADAWERQNFGTLANGATGDADGDGASNLAEQGAGTNPNNASDVFRITYIARGDVTPDFTTLRWTSKPTHFYTIQARPTLDVSTPWFDSIGYGFGVSNSTFSTGTTNNFEFYRIRAYRPLGP
jgi:hypothetical protein